MAGLVGRVIAAVLPGVPRDHRAESGCCVGRTGLFAGKPAPTGRAQCPNLSRSCGSGLAREEAGTG
ncbi:hypothetical protein CXB65_17145 [Pseudomonas monteilii]|uniref:Uncharacterized protein n=1 Tax=Pseudomonas monteilii TaxID=76759 RepID=A0A2N1IPD2_9PSED|nr:hypothetical protein CXB65_17145 [Pseudomonas monteilii]RPD92764.1 hypothetical protein EGN69_23120 [Pseudomonas monteilii]